jgi:hAT family C-terminal dimerisation region
LYYPLIDALLFEIRDRFAPATSTLLSNLSVLHPQNNDFLDGNKIKNLALELDLDLTCTMNENNVLSHMFTSDRKPEDIIDLFHQIRPLKHAFPNMFNLVTIAITMPVSSTTCERTFSRLKLIKTFARNKMGDGRLSDMAILAIEREIMIDLDQTVEQFSKKHINSRILLL